jgi:hypothetical protein
LRRVSINITNIEMGQTTSLPSSTKFTCAAILHISDYCAGQGNRQIPVQHSHNSGPELRATCFDTSVVPCLGFSALLGKRTPRYGLSVGLQKREITLHAMVRKLIRSQTTTRLTNRHQNVTRTRVGRFSYNESTRGVTHRE